MKKKQRNYVRYLVHPLNPPTKLKPLPSLLQTARCAAGCSRAGASPQRAAGSGWCRVDAWRCWRGWRVEGRWRGCQGCTRAPEGGGLKGWRRPAGWTRLCPIQRNLEEKKGKEYLVGCGGWIEMFLIKSCLKLE